MTLVFESGASAFVELLAAAGAGVLVLGEEDAPPSGAGGAGGGSGAGGAGAPTLRPARAAFDAALAACGARWRAASARGALPGVLVHLDRRRFAAPVRALAETLVKDFGFARTTHAQLFRALLTARPLAEVQNE
jgi:hypothetical protein